MPTWLPTAYYATDLFCAVAFPLLALWLGRSARLPGAWRIFWLGTALGLLWELPIFALSAWSGQPVIRWLAPLPAPAAVFIVAHSLWDGGIFLGGYALALGLTGGRPLGWTGLLLQVGWGQLTALLVELSSLSAGAWVYVEGLPGNPVLLYFLGKPLTALPQIIWLVAPVAFVGLARRLVIDGR